MENKFQQNNKKSTKVLPSFKNYNLNKNVPSDKKTPKPPGANSHKISNKGVEDNVQKNNE